MPNMVVVLMVKPIAAMAAKVPMMVTGMVVAGTSVARQSCRNTMITISTSRPASIRVMKTSLIDAFTNIVVSNGIEYSSPLGNALESSAILARTRLATSSALAFGSW